MSNRTILKTPLNEKIIRELKTGDEVLLNGTIFTARDEAHKYLAKETPDFGLKNSIIYHCGPIVKKQDDQYKIISAGPTTSAREEPYEAEIIKKYQIKAIIGKGGMGEKTMKAMKEHGCVYLSTVGGAAALLAKSIKQVKNVYKLEFGTPEAIWELEVENMPAVVTIDSDRNSIYDDVQKNSRKRYDELISH